jgi:hypothetical protein
MKDDLDQPLDQKNKERPFTRWVMVVALLGAGATPCPECGMPLAVHLWPLALLLVVARVVADRARPRLDDQTAPEQQLDPDVEKEISL